MMGLFIYDHEIEPIDMETEGWEITDLEGVRVYDENGNVTDV